MSGEWARGEGHGRYDRSSGSPGPGKPPPPPPPGRGGWDGYGAAGGSGNRQWERGGRGGQARQEQHSGSDGRGRGWSGSSSSRGDWGSGVRSSSHGRYEGGYNDRRASSQDRPPYRAEPQPGQDRPPYRTESGHSYRQDSGGSGENRFRDRGPPSHRHSAPPLRGRQPPPPESYHGRQVAAGDGGPSHGYRSYSGSRNAQYNGRREGTPPHQFEGLHHRKSAPPKHHPSQSNGPPPPPSDHPPGSVHGQQHPPHRHDTAAAGSTQWDDAHHQQRDEHTPGQPRPPPLVSRASAPGAQFRSSSGPSTFGGSPNIMRGSDGGAEARAPQTQHAPAPAQPETPVDVLSPAGRARIEAERQQLAVDIAVIKRKMALTKVVVCEHRVKQLRPGHA